MIALDTSVLARYILNDNPAESLVAERLISENACSVSWSVLIELCWVLESKARLPRSEIARSMIALVESDFLSVPDDILVAWAIERYASGADFADMIHLASTLNGEIGPACVSLDSPSNEDII